jgi:hypothetical protein
MHQTRLIIAFILLLLTACSSPQPKPQQTAAQPELIQLDNFSITIPGKSRWYTTMHNAESVHLVKRGNAPDETYVIQAWSLKLPDFQSDEAFSSFMEKSIFKDSNNERFNQINKNVTAVETEHGVCIRFKSILEDNSAVKKSENSEPMLLEVEGITCRNPSNRFIASLLVFSNRYYEGNRDTNLAKKADEFFSSLEFTKENEVDAEPLPQPEGSI